MAGTNKGDSCPLPPRERDCKELDDGNKDTRNEKHVEKATEKKNEKGEEVTVATAFVYPPCSKIVTDKLSGTSISGTIRRTLLTSNERKSLIQIKQGIALAPTAKEIKGNKPKTAKGVDFCDNLKNHKPFDSNNVMGQFRACTGHAESAILTTLGKAGCLTGANQLLFKINWPNPGKETMPCRNCYELMKKVSEACDIDIHICDEENNPKSIKEDAKFKDYNDLEEDVTSATGEGIK
ncbi:hypothetical protein [Serratia silvae]|uniref:CMP/dCMP-type deaminase domain-containing protein n=1 Tax=Serratia silvae TaxID=2824122 RepID=A0ABT0KC72_9GAMM|nr:hypothetical protein [Serratia silvae]MCL1029173.1 hypothetical protein [Serratia silvae]